MGGPRKPRLKVGRRAAAPYDFKVSAGVIAARAKRGRQLDLKVDRCKNCLHFLTTNHCGLDQHFTTPEGCCALHDRAASEVEPEMSN